MEKTWLILASAVFCLIQNGLSVAAINDAPSEPRDDSVDNYIKLVIENFAAAMKTGIPILGIPVLDPLNITKLTIPDIETEQIIGRKPLDTPFNLKAKVVRIISSSYNIPNSVRTGSLILKANASDISVSGTSSFSPAYVHVDFDNNQMFLDLHFVDVRIDGMYWCDGLLLVIFPVFGDGFFYIDIVSTDSTGLGGITVTDDDHLQITDLGLNLTFDHLDLYFDNFLGGGSFGEEMNEAIDALAESIVKAMIPLLNDALLPSLVNYLNNALMEHTISEIIDGILPGPPSLLSL